MGHTPSTAWTFRKKFQKIPERPRTRSQIFSWNSPAGIPLTLQFNAFEGSRAFQEFSLCTSLNASRQRLGEDIVKKMCQEALVPKTSNIICNKNHYLAMPEQGVTRRGHAFVNHLSEVTFCFVLCFFNLKDT